MHNTKIAALAVAATLGLPTLASADSNVTVYGLIGLNVGYEKAGDLSRLGIDHSGAQRQPHLASKGNEDLGSGQKALFVLESGFDPSTGTSEQGGRLYGRQAYVGVEGGWGKADPGSPVFARFLRTRAPTKPPAAPIAPRGLLYRKADRSSVAMRPVSIT